MTLKTLAYLLYLAITVPLTIYVARTLFRNGRVFLHDVFNGNDALADAVNRLLRRRLLPVQPRLRRPVHAERRDDRQHRAAAGGAVAPRRRSLRWCWASCTSSTCGCSTRSAATRPSNAQWAAAGRP